MKGKSIKNKFIAMFLMGAFFIIFIASTGIYGTVKGMKEMKGLYEKNYYIRGLLAHLKEDIRNTRVELVTMALERNPDKKILHKNNMESLDADISLDLDILIKEVPAGNAVEPEDLLKIRKIWQEFLGTRYGVLIPMIMDRKYDEARKVAGGIQQERYLAMIGLLEDFLSTINKYVEKKHAEMEKKGKGLLMGIILLMGSGLAVGAVVFYAFSRDILTRISALQAGIHRLTDGDISARVRIGGEDELASLGDAFNWMADSIQENNDLLLKNERELHEKNMKLNEAMIEARQHAIVMEHAAKEREEQNKKLKDAVEEAEAANRQLAETQTKLLQSEKMASVGQLAAGVAHEINNPVGYVNGNLSTLDAYIGDIKTLEDKYGEVRAAVEEGRYERVRELMAEIERLRTEKDIDFAFDDLSKLVSESKEGLNRVTSIVKDLKQFSHTGEAEAKEYDINKGLESTLNIVWNEIKYNADVKKEYGDIPLVYCYPQQLNQVFMNLLVNAAHALEDKNTFGVRSLEFGVLPAPNAQLPTPGADNGKGLIKIKTYHNPPPQPSPSRGEGEGGGGYVCVEISDNGCGIPEDKIRKIFDPFFTTKPVGKGTGLGLSVVYNIVKKHKGDIDIKSMVGEGTTFTIRLPVNGLIGESVNG